MISKSFAGLTKRSQTVFLSQTTQKAFSTSSQLKYAPWKESKILVTGCQGQIGVPLVRALCNELGADRVVASDM